MIVDKKFLKEVSKLKKHTFISTGMSTKEDIEKAVNIFKENKCSFELMHCVSTYPMKPEDANLETINALRETFKCDVGYSGHENGVAVSLAAAYYNITSLERHITLDKELWGSDHKASLEPKELSELVAFIREIEASAGNGGPRSLLQGEKDKLKSLRG